MASSHVRSFCSVRSKKRFSDLCSKQFSRGYSENHRNPEGSKSDPPYSGRDTGSDFERCDRANRRFSESMFISDFRDPQENGRSSGHSEPQRVQSFSFNPTFSNGDFERYFTTAVSQGLGCVNRFEGCLPPHSDPPGIQEVLGFSVLEHDLSVQGSTLRPQGLALGIHKGSGDSYGLSPPPRSQDFLLPGRLATCSGVQGALGASSSDGPPVDTGLRVPGELEEVFLDTAEDSFLSRGSVGHPESVGSSFRAQDCGSSGGGSGSHRRLLGNRPLVAEVPRASRQFCGLGSQLQVVDEASAASFPAVLHSSGRSSGQVDSGEPRDQGLVQGVGLSLSSSRGETFCPPSAFSGSFHGCLSEGVGGSSSSTSSVRGVVEEGGLGSHKFPRVEGGFSRASVPRVSCRGSFGSDSFRQYDRGVLHQSSGRDSFLVPVSAGLGPVGMVSFTENLPSGSSHSRRRECCGGLPLQGEVPSFGVDSESLRLSEDLSSVVASSGDRLVRFGAQLSAPEVLLPVSGCSSLEDRRTVISVDRSSPVRVSSFLSSPQDLGQDCPGGGGSSSGSSVLASEALVSASSSTLGGLSKGAADSQGPGGATPVFDALSQGRKSSSFSLASLRQQGEDAGLSQRAAQFAAEAFRQSTRDTYDSRLVPFREWCAKVPCDPTSASLGVVADYLLSQFDKGLAVNTLRSCRSAIASCHRGFSDGSTVTDSRSLTRLLKSFFLKRPPSKTLIPAWSLPAVLQVLASAPFEPLHKASLRHLTLKTVFLVAIASGHRVSSLQALCVDPGHLRWEASGVRLIPRLGFYCQEPVP